MRCMVRFKGRKTNIKTKKKHEKNIKDKQKTQKKTTKKRGAPLNKKISRMKKVN
jgi:hypothetical protein